MRQRGGGQKGVESEGGARRGWRVRQGMESEAGGWRVRQKGVESETVG